MENGKNMIIYIVAQRETLVLDLLEIMENCGIDSGAQLRGD